ncbi:MAG: hypothetical protein BWY42_00274 [Candidatus Omnitrophica bacterium ADurb.Bin277]|nr:MAG: hypothetical protein BWY42_00274 [Candidatus Omnitrophica bacterium ADurb.Bin277]
MKERKENEWAAMLALNRLGIEERRRARDLLGEGKSAVEILEMLGSVEWDGFDPGKEVALCRQKGIRLLSVCDADYPKLLKEIPDPPLVIYVKGTFEDNDANAVAIVGTRHPSFYGKTQAKRFAGELAGKGVTIVSGLARGIDQAAHEAALEIPCGRTIAVLGCGIDVVYPKENEKLFSRIFPKGALVSEYALGTPPFAENFPRRNRIISGLSLGTLVIEAHSRSGSLITAHQALDQGREVFALPGPVDQLTSRGTHRLIREGALLAEDPEEIFEALSSRWIVFYEKPAPGIFLEEPAVSAQNPIPQDNSGDSGEVRQSDVYKIERFEESGAVIEALKEEGGLLPEEILDITGIEPGRIPGLLLTMELGGLVRKTPDGRYFAAK